MASLLTVLDRPHKQPDGGTCLLCPRCGEFLALINPRTNLARCFRCETNFNAIDLTILIKARDFATAMHFKHSWPRIRHVPLKHNLLLESPGT